MAGIRKAFIAFDEQCRQHITAGSEKDLFHPKHLQQSPSDMKALGKDSRFGPPDRIFLIGETLTGILAIGGNRVHQTAAPIDKDSVTVKVTKIEGGNAAVVKICAVGEDGSMRNVGTIDFAKNNEAGEKSVTVSGVRGKILRMDISGSAAVAVKQFQYRLATN